MCSGGNVAPMRTFNSPAAINEKKIANALEFSFDIP